MISIKNIGFEIIITICRNKQVCISLITLKIVSSEELAELLKHKELTKGTTER